jgi:hypothetical protein
MKRIALLNALKMVLPGVDKSGSTVLEGANTFIFDGQYIKSFNDNLSVSYPFETKIKCSIKAEEFFKSIDKMSGEDINIELKDSKLQINDGSTELLMNISEANIEQYIDNFDLDNLDWKDLPKDFFEGINQCIFSASTRPDQGVLNAISINGKNIMSSDNLRISWFVMDGEIDTLLLPLNAAKELCKIPKLSSYFIGENWAHFANEEVIISTRIMLGEYPSTKIEELFTPENSTKYSFPAGTSKSLEKAEILSYSDPEGNYDNFISIYAQKDHLFFKGERIYGSIKDKIKIDPKSFPADIEIRIAPSFLKSILAHSNEFQVKNESLILFSSNKFKHLISTATK